LDPQQKLESTWNNSNADEPGTCGENIFELLKGT
jgi:hypothetical protein